MSGDTPALMVEWGTTPGQRVVEGTLATLPALAREHDIQPPALTVVGEVVRLRAEGLDWYAPLRTAVGVMG
jgi:siroheme synthase